MPAWKKYKLGDLAKDIAMGPFGSDLKMDNFISSGVPVIKGGNLVDGGFERSNFSFVSEAKAQSLKRCLAYPGQLVFTHRGTLGQVGIIPYNKFPYYLVSQSQMRLEVKENLLNSTYLYYFFKTSTGQQELLKNTSQVGVPAIASPTKSLREVEISIPTDLPTQTRIASILSALDNKIELNRQMNQTLEQMAQALFKKYFVDDIDPDNLPEGWVRGVLGELMELQRGFDLPNDLRDYGQIPVYSASGINGFHSTAMVKAPGVTTGRSGIIGNVFYILDDFWPLNTSLFVKTFHKASPLYAYYVLKSVDLKGLNTGSAVPTLNRNHVHALPCNIPNSELIEKFEKEVVAFFKLIKCNDEQTKKLTQTRDTLLPKLMSGEIDVNTKVADEILS